MAGTWVEHRAMKRQNLRQAADVWQSVRTAVDHCCSDFRAYFADLGTVTSQVESSHRVWLEIQALAGWKRQVAIEFDESGPRIVVAIDQLEPKTFKIEADESHPYLSHEGQEINADGFTHLALEEALFEAPKAKHAMGA